MRNEYLIGVAAVAGLTVLAVVAVVVLRPNADNTAIITTIVGITAPIIGALVMILRSAGQATDAARAAHRSAQIAAGAAVDATKKP